MSAMFQFSRRLYEKYREWKLKEAMLVGKDCRPWLKAIFEKPKLMKLK